MQHPLHIWSALGNPARVLAPGVITSSRTISKPQVSFMSHCATMTGLVPEITMPRLLSILGLIMLCTIGCARNNDGTWKAPLVYRIDVQQGNVVDQQMINKLKPGMDKKQVKFIMGTPLLIDPFHTDRWDYLYSFEPGGGEREQRRVTLFFNGEHLARVEGDIKVTDRPLADEEPQKDRSVAVPLEDNKPGFFKRMFSRNKSAQEDAGGSLNATEATDTEASTTAIPEPVPAGTEATGTKTSTDSTPEPAPVGTTPETATTAPLDQETGDAATKTAIAPESTASTKTHETDVEKSTAGDTQEKNLLRRFWDRMTKSGNESDTNEESEQDKRDAEVLQGAGGDL